MRISIEFGSDVLSEPFDKKAVFGEIAFFVGLFIKKVVNCDEFNFVV